MVLVVLGGIIAAIVGFFFIYTAVRLGVTDALRGTLPPELLLPEPVTTFRLDAGDDELETTS